MFCSDKQHLVALCCTPCAGEVSRMRNPARVRRFQCPDLENNIEIKLKAVLIVAAHTSVDQLLV